MITPPYDLGVAAVVFRCFGFIVSLPLGDALSTVPRLFVALAFAMSLSTHAQMSVDLHPAAFIFEFVIGFLLGAPLRFVADVSEMVGELIDTARGQTISSVMDPLHGQGSSDLATLAKVGATALAIWSGGLTIAVDALAHSFSVVPVGHLAVDGSLTRSVLTSGLFLLEEGLRISAVWMAAFLLIDIGCGLAARLASGLSFSQAGGIAKMVTTFLLLIVLLTEGGRVSRGRLHELIQLKGVGAAVPDQDQGFTRERGAPDRESGGIR